MPNMPDIPIHFDHVLGSDPEWRRLLLAAFMGNPTPMQMQMLAMGGISPSTVRFLDATYSYAKEGHQTFAVGPAMQEVFEECELTDVPLELMQLPYNCFWIAMPGCKYRVWGDDRTEWHQVAGCYIHQFAENNARVLVWGMPNDKSINARDDANFWFDINLAGVKGRQEGGYTILNIEEYLQECFNTPGRDQSDPLIKAQAKRHMRETQGEFVQVLRIALNLVLYLNSDKPEARPDSSRVAALKKATKDAARKKSPSKKAKAQARAAKMSAAHVTWIGETVERQAKQASEASGRSGVTLHRRRGHRHSYWTGPRKLANGTRQKGDKIIIRFVAPTWVGGKPSPEQKGKHPGRVYQLEGDAD